MEVLTMADRRTFITFEAGKELHRMIEQRAKQEGVSISEYVREASFFEMLFSGDEQAVKYIQKKIGKRLRGVLLDKLKHAGGIENAEAWLMAG